MGTATRRLRSEPRLVMHWCRSMSLVYSSDNGRPAKRPGPTCGASESGMRAGIEDKRFLKKTGKRKRKGAWWGLPPCRSRTPHSPPSNCWWYGRDHRVTRASGTNTARISGRQEKPLSLCFDHSQGQRSVSHALAVKLMNDEQLQDKLYGRACCQIL